MTVDELIQLKNLKNYSNAKIAELSGVPEVTIQKIFSGTTQKPRQGTLLAIERALTAPRGRYSYDAINELGADSTMFLREDELAYRIPRKANGAYTLEDYYALPEGQRVELIEGKYFQMYAPNLVHQDIAFALHSQIHAYIRSKGGQCRVFEAPVDVELGDERNIMVQPDVLVVCDPKKITRERIVGAPDFVLEILSDGTRRKDLSVKVDIYGKWGVKEYWMIDPAKQLLIRYDFTDPEYCPMVQPLTGQLGLLIYQGDCMIDLDEIRQIINP